MSDDDKRLTELGREVIKLHRAAEAAKGTSLERGKQAGEKLIEAKKRLKRGLWLPWLQAIDLPERTAQAYIQIAQLPAAKYATVADLGLRAALEAVRKPKGSRGDAPAQRGQPAREGADYWPTPQTLIDALVQHVIPTLPAGAPVWECAAGDGRLVEAILRSGRDVVASDRYPQDGNAAVNFLTDEPPAAAIGAIAITNPPFNDSEAFIERGLWLMDNRLIQGLVLLMRHDHLMAGSRVDAFNRVVREVHCNWRPRWIEDSEGNPRWSFHWLAWHAGPRKPPLYLCEDDLAIARQEAAE